jgi:HAE1 family hydrophobic/amphiphilic exporter-1
MLFLAVVFLGAISFQRLPIDLLPDIAYPKLVVYTSYPNVAPAEVERLVTERVERNVAGVPGVEHVESSSREGVSLVTLRFGWGTDMDFAALNVREKLDNVTGLLPEQASRPVVLRTDPTAEPIMALSVAGQHDLWALKELGESVFKRRLEQIDGVAQAAITGGLERQIHVEIDPRRLESFGLTIDEIETALKAANAAAPGGTVLRGRYRYSLRTLGELRAVEEIGDIIVKRQDGGRGAGSTSGAAGGGANAGGRGGTGSAQALISLRDVARIEDGFRERESIARFNGQDAVGILIFKESGTNSVRVAESVEAVLEELRAEHPGVAIEIAMNQADFVSEAISNVVDALVQGGILAFLVLFLFLRDARYPITIALSIPISVIATFALLDLAGVSLNIMSLGGLALGVGMLVDNSIVVLENIFRHRERGLHGAAAAAVGTEEVISAIIGATLTTVAVFGPIIYVQGVAGQLFGAVSYAVSFSLLASLVVAMLLVPTIAARWGADMDRATAPTRNPLRLLGRFLGSLLKRIFGPLLDAFDRVFTRFIGSYEISLEAALRHRGRVVAAAALLLVLAGGAALTLDRAVLPSVEQGTLRLRIELPRGTPIEETARVATHVESVLLADSAVTAVFTRVGRQDALAGIDLEESGLNTALLEVRLGPKATSSAVIERARGQLAGYPPGVVSVDAGQATALGRLLGGGESELAIRVRGDDLDQALDYARGLTARLAASADLTNVRLGTELGQPEIRVEIDRERAAAFGIEPIRIAQTIEKYMLGTRATDLVDFDRKIPIIVSLPDEARRSLETLDILRVDGIPLRELVRTHESVGPTEIQRVNQARLIPIYADGRGRDLTQAFAAAQQVVDQNPAPPGIRAEIGGENEEMRRSFRDLAFAFTLAILLVYMILAAEFESLVHPFTVLLSIPLAVVGAVLALRITGAGLNAMSLIGIVILVGIAVNNAIVMVDFVNQMRKKGMVTREAILESARARLRPIVMTTVTTLLGILPMAIGIGRGADLRAPLAIAIFGGLFTSTALTLIVVPVAYDLVDGAGRWLQARFRGAESIVRSAPVTAQAHDAAATANEAGTREVPAGD